MYVLVRSDLPPGLQAAQAAHAASYLAAEDPLLLYQHPTITLLGVESEDELRSESLKAYVGFMFREPDLGGAPTAFAAYHTGECWSHLPLALA